VRLFPQQNPDIDEEPPRVMKIDMPMTTSSPTWSTWLPSSVVGNQTDRGGDWCREDGEWEHTPQDLV
jgi:hypothetical protein